MFANWLTSKDLKSLESMNKSLEKAKDINILKASNGWRKGLEGLPPAARKAAQGLDGTSDSLKNAQKESFSLKGALKNLGYSLLNAGLMMAASWIIGVIVEGIDKLINKVERARKTTEEALQDLNESNSAIEEINGSLATTIERIDELEGKDQLTFVEANELSELRKVNEELSTRLAIEKAINEEKNKAAAKALLDEADTILEEDTQYKSPYAKDYYSEYTEAHGGATPPVYIGFVDGKTYIDEAIQLYTELNELKKEGAEYDEAIYNGTYDSLVTLAGSLNTLIADSDGLAIDEVTLRSWKGLRDAIAGALGLIGSADIDGAKADLAKQVANRYDAGKSSSPILNQLKGWENGFAEDFLSETNKTSNAYKAVEAWAETYKLSMEDAIDLLKEYDFFQGEATNQEAWDSIVDGIKKSSDAIEEQIEIYEDWRSTTEEQQSAVKKLAELTGIPLDMDSESFEKDLALIKALLNDDRDAALSCLQAYGAMSGMSLSPSGITSGINAIIEAANNGSVAAQALLKLLMQLGAVKMKGIPGMPGVSIPYVDGSWVDTQFSGTKGGGGGGGNKNITSKAYDEAKAYTEWQIEMSEKRQERMSEESDEYIAEQANQYALARQIAEKTLAEINRLRAKGIDESNEQFRELLGQYEDYCSQVYDIAKQLWEAERDAKVEALQDQKEAENDRWDEREKQLDYEIERTQTLVDLEENYLDLIGQTKTERKELEKQLAISKSAYDYLDEETRKSLFNDDDYKLLVGKLDEIEAYAESLYVDYQSTISSVTADTVYELEFITNEYERQYELLMKQYEVSKADLAVARARRDLENILNERNVAMLVNGVWTWVADPESVKAAVEAVYDAESDAEDALTELYNEQRVQALQEYLDSIGLMKEAEQAAHDKIVEQLEDMIANLEDLEFTMVEFERIIEEGGSKISSAVAGAVSAIRSAGSSAVAAIKDASKGNKANTGMGVSKSTFATGGVADFTGDAHMDGTRSAAEVVFNSADAKKLYDYVHEAPSLISSFIRRVSPAVALTAGAKSSSIVNRNIYINGIQLDRAQSDTLVSALQRVLPIISNT